MPVSDALRRSAGALVLTLAPAIATSQVPAGSDFQANSYTTGHQTMPAVGVAPDGTFVVAWRNVGDYTIRARHFDAAGVPTGPEFRAHDSPDALRHQLPAVAGGGNGRFVVAWDAIVPGSQDAQARLFDHSGRPLGPEFTVSAFTANAQVQPSVSADGTGRFVVAWWGSTAHDGVGVAARRFDASGAPLGGDIRVNTYTAFWQQYPSVAADAAGRFVVVWSSDQQDGSGYGIFGQRFDEGGQALGAEFRANGATSGDQSYPSVAMAPTGEFLVAWTNSGVGTVSGEIFARRYDAAGVPQGAEFQVNGDTPWAQHFAKVASDAAGTFLVTWHCTRADEVSFGICGRRFERDGAPRGSEFRLNSYTPGSQAWPSAAMDAVGNFVVSWESEFQDGSGRGAFGRRFGGLQPIALAVDVAGGPGSDANGVLEPGEGVDVRPSWRNVNGTAQAFSANLAGISGPPGATYAITDAAGDYGTVANGATGQCADCFGLSVSDPPARPAAHWDASALEGLLPDAQGQRKTWRFHVGDSFTDVPRSNPFYRSVEALFHHSVTGGCSGGSYCPASVTAREQMAVFVLLAKEGAGYAPAACTTPVFADVPASSPFCRWIEDLARRGVAGGCGGGNFCPSAAVPREQMPVFVLRTLDPSLEPPPCSAPMFADVPAASPFCRWIEELARRGVVTGCGGGNYCPFEPVTRDQMAVFIAVTFGLALYGP